MLQLSQRPLTGSDADRKLFVNRTAELGHLQRAAQFDFNVLLLGERGIGLTSLMHQHQRELNDSGRSSFYVNAGQVDDLSQLATAIRRVVEGPRRPGDAFAQRLITELSGMLVTQDSLHPLRDLWGLSTEDRESEIPKPIVILDGMYQPQLVHEMFGRYRDDLWQVPLRWVVCGLATRRSAYLEPPADAFFESVLTVGPLDGTASRDLLQTRLVAASSDDAEATVRIISGCDRIVELSGGNPRRLLAEARDTVLRSPEETASADRLVDDAAALGKTETLAIRHLLTHGPTSASDQRLLEGLDITRARATQVLRRLEDAGLVYGFHDKGGVGRPRKLYATRLSHGEAE